MGVTLIIDNYYLPGTDKNNLRHNEYSGIITYQYEESAEAQHATQVARDATLKGIKLCALFWPVSYTHLVTVGNIGWYTWDITRMEREWQRGAYVNNGIFLVSNNEGSQWYKRFYSLEGTNKPVFTINYRDINRNFTATGRPGAINSSSQFIDVSWTNTPGVSVKVCLDGKEYTLSLIHI